MNKILGFILCALGKCQYGDCVVMGSLSKRPMYKCNFCGDHKLLTQEDINKEKKKLFIDNQY